jgi:hypothetical protein
VDWQLPVVIAALASALGYVARSAWRTWFGAAGKGCASGCDGCAKPAAPAAEGDGRRIALPRI